MVLVGGEGRGGGGEEEGIIHEALTRAFIPCQSKLGVVL